MVQRPRRRVADLRLVYVGVGIMILNTLEFGFTIDEKQEYRNVSKYKRKLTPVVKWNIKLLIDGIPINEDQVFEPGVFFDSIRFEGRHPMFNCTCGIFGCGGYYVDVTHQKDHVTWVVEQDKLKDNLLQTEKKCVFSWNNLIKGAEDLILNLNELNNKLAKNGLEACFRTDEYLKIIEGIKKY